VDMNFDLERYEKSLETSSLTTEIGKVTEVRGFLIKGFVPGACLGSLCEIVPSSGEPFLSEVIGFEDSQVKLMPLGEMSGVALGSKIILVKQRSLLQIGDELVGRVINGMGEPIDGKGELDCDEEVDLYADVPNPMQRPPIDNPLSVGVRAIDGFLTVGQGQRVGILAGSGVGKSMLLGMMAKSSTADINVIALIGERGREVREFIEHTLGEEGLRKSVIVCVTSNESALLRTRGAFVASSVAEYFSSQGANVLLMMDSVTRFAMAQREIGLNLGEPPTSKGYTPSVFALLPKLLERAGSFEGKGSITGLYTVLVEGDDMDEPIADAVRSIVDGHIVLDRKLAQRGQFPAVDVLQSSSRVMRNITGLDHLQAASQCRELLATYSEAEDLINIGAYQQGSNPMIDASIRSHQALLQFLKQDVAETSTFDETVHMLQHIGQGGGE
jgi:flagellum-specific ATP synthase